MSGYRVRPLSEKDIEAIIAIDARLTGERGPDRAGFWRGLLSIQLPATVEGDAPPPAVPHHLCQVAETSGGSPRVVGFIIGDVQSWQFGLPRHGRIVAIGVDPDHARSGVATLLAEALIGVLRKMGLPFVQCLVRPGDALEAFFASLGFEQPGFRILEKTLQGGPVRDTS
jgi:ribosomal protein S18 acetylase RimI-like enzyme